MTTRGTPGWASRRAAVVPIEVRRFEGITYVSWSRFPVPPAPVDPEPVADPTLVADRRQASEGETTPDADLIERVLRAVDVDGRTPGRRALAREFGVTEHKIRTILDHAATNGRGTPWSS